MIGRTNVGGGSVEKATIIAIASVGDTVTISLGTKTQTKTLTSGDRLTFTVLNFGTWLVTNGEFSATININAAGTYEVNTLGKIFGIKRLITSSSPVWERTDYSENFTAVASVGTDAGHSDFDSMPIYSEIERVTFSTGDVMVKIPKFYFQRYIDSNDYEIIRITDRPMSGFSVHPAFLHNGSEQDYIYVGAYKTSEGNKSLTGKSPKINITRATFRSGAAAKGSEWSIIDVTSSMAITMLILVEFATNNLQLAIGDGFSNNQNSNAKNTGGCDSVPNLTGRPAGTSNTVQVVWRGIEDIWGNKNEYVDGLNWNGGSYYICNNQSQYADNTTTNYTLLSYVGLTSWTSLSYISRLGYDSNNPAIMLPSEASDASSSTYYTDTVIADSGWMVGIRGGAHTQTVEDGLFFWRFDRTKDNATVGSNQGTLSSRLLYIPPSV